MFPLLVKFEGVGEGQGESIPSPGDGVSGVPPWLRWGFGGLSPGNGVSGVPPWLRWGFGGPSPGNGVSGVPPGVRASAVSPPARRPQQQGGCSGPGAVSAGWPGPSRTRSAVPGWVTQGPLPARWASRPPRLALGGRQRQGRVCRLG